jgi:AcrR family transcriptional regulator
MVPFVENDGVHGGPESPRLSASERCAALYIERGTADITIAEIASEVGISQRTFYRYFPTKAESIAPLFDWTTRRFDEAVIESPADSDLLDVLRAAFRASLGGEVASRTRSLFPLVFVEPELWSVFLRKVHDGERALAPLLAVRLGVDPSEVAARAVAAAVASSTRIALEVMVTTGADAEQVYLQTLDAFAPQILRHR